MVYMEFIDWDRRIPSDVFQLLVQQKGWTSPEDRKIVNIGRHKGLGARPAYLCGWRIRDLARLDEWEVHFKSLHGLTDRAELAAFQGLDFVHCGLYDELLCNDLGDEGIHFVEFFDAGDADDAELLAHIEHRATANQYAPPACLFRRVGLLGPADSDVIVWSFPSFAALEAIARERHGNSPFAPKRVGVYRNVDHELM